MQDKYAEKIPELTYEQMDVKKMTFTDMSYDVIIDKACLDAQLCGDNSAPNSTCMLKEVHRVLAHDGVYICVTYGHPEMRMHYFEGRNDCDFDWKVLKTQKATKQTVSTKQVIEEGSKDLTYFDYIYIMKRTADAPIKEEDD